MELGLQLGSLADTLRVIKFLLQLWSQREEREERSNENIIRSQVHTQHTSPVGSATGEGDQCQGSESAQRESKRYNKKNQKGV